MRTVQKIRAAELHRNVPPNWYAQSIKENILQRLWHTTRFREVGKLIPVTRGKILDIGCADGTFTKVILEHSKAKKIVAVDVLESSVSYAKRRFARSKKLFFKVADAHKLPFKNKEFDAVFCLEALEHVENPRRVVQEMHRVLKNGGYAIILVPSENLLFRLGWPIWTLTRGKIWKGTHLNDFSAGKLTHLMKEEKFTVDGNHKFLLGMLQAIKAIKQ